LKNERNSVGELYSYMYELETMHLYS